MEDSQTCKKTFIRGTVALEYFWLHTVPKWCKLPKQLTQAKCANSSCTGIAEHQKLTIPAFTSIDEIKTVFYVEANKDYPFVLCHTCYCHAYNLLHPKKSCKSCGAIPKGGVSFSRHSPDAEVVTEHLQRTTEYDTVIDRQDVLCFSCYKLHCSTIKSLITFINMQPL